MIEKEPKFREVDEAIENGLEQKPSDTSQKREVSAVAPMPIKGEVPKTVEQIVGVSVSFKNLHKLVGKNILFRDPHTQPNRTDDPSCKEAIIEQHDGKFVIVVNRGKYYPYYTGSRQNIFALDSQENIDRYEVKLER